jgi:hypothetical protein
MSDNVVILIPVYHDWNALLLLLRALDQALVNVQRPVSVLVVDDGSTVPVPDASREMTFERIRTLDLLRLKRNLGHQRALATGLCYIAAERPCRAVVLMDGDGEDAPRDVPRLLEHFERHGAQSIVFAERRKRSERVVFRAFYHVYRAVHFLLTGIAVRVGNFSVVPGSLVPRLAVVSDLWNHYAASVFKSRLPYLTLPTRRARRLDGHSRMSFTALVTHGLSALSVFQDRVGVRLLLAVLLLTGAAGVALAVAAVVRVTTHVTIPGWATTTAASLILTLLQTTMLVSCFVFLALGGRDSATFLPVRDCPFFIDRTERLFPRGG